jgi:hypothetical protein
MGEGIRLAGWVSDAPRLICMSWFFKLIEFGNFENIGILERAPYSIGKRRVKKDVSQTLFDKKRALALVYYPAIYVAAKYCEELTWLTNAYCLFCRNVRKLPKMLCLKKG